MAKQESIQTLKRQNEALQKANTQLLRQIEELQTTKPSTPHLEDLKKKDSQSNRKLKEGKKVPELTREFLDQRITERTIDLKVDREKLLRLNTLYEETNKFAQVGGWEIDLVQQSAIFTPQTFDIYELPHNETPSIEEGINYYHPDDRQLITSVVAHAIEHHEPYDVEVRLITAKNNEIWVRTKGSPVIENGTVIRLHGSIQDISKQKQNQIAYKKAQEIAESSEHKLNEAQQVAKVGSWHLDLITGEITWSNELYTMYGFDPKKPIPPLEEHAKFMEPESWELLNSALESTIKTGEDYTIELKTVKTKGDWQWILGRGRAIFDTENNIIGINGIAQDITERKLAEIKQNELIQELNKKDKELSKAYKELQDKHKELEKEKRFKDSLTEGSTTGIYIHNLLTKKHDYVNSRYEEILGWTKEDLNNKSSEDLYGLVHPDDLHKLENSINEIITTGTNQTVTYRFKHKDGHWIWGYGIDAPYERDEYGNVISFIGSFYDITELINTQTSLNTINKQLNLATETAKLGIWTLNVETDELQWNDKLHGIYGLTKEEFGKNPDSWRERVLSEDLAYADEKLASIFEGKSVYDVEFRIVLPNGEIRYINASGTPILNNKGEVESLIGINVDITHIREKDKVIANKTDRYEFLTNFLPDIFWTSDAEGGLTYINDSGLKVLGLSQEKLLADGWFEVIHPNDVPKVAEKWTKATQEKSSYTNEQRMKTADGSYQWFKVNASPKYNEIGDIDEWVGLSINIQSEKAYLEKVKDSKRELERSSKKLLSIINSVPGAVFNCDWDDAFSMNFLSSYIEEITGYKSKEFTHRGKIRYSDIVVKDDLDNLNKKLAAALAKNERYMVNYRIKTKKGEERWLMEKGEFNNDGDKITTDGVIIDITEQIKSEEKLIQAIYSTEDATRKEISRDLHDGLQQSLIVSKMNMEAVLREAKKLSNTTRKRLDVGYEYLTKSIAESRTISHNLVPKTIKDDGLIKSVEHLLETLPSNISIIFHKNFDHLRFDERIELGMYRIMQEALNNILKHSGARQIIIQLYNKESHISLSIEDDGVGFDVDTALDRGTHYGLLSIKSRTTLLGGECHIDSVPNKGTSIMLEIPLE